ncbi:DUF5305 domain-containing protein [Haloglomus litoreum]|uniref:DUF5305 domain-containing protein n=1 Tax=Haloglomus litoreum TaxID=3034026 RepID=UPI0023E78016|nr:DUF5305 domain-containing protein [Haloglomus sp. DT116]
MAGNSGDDGTSEVADDDGPGGTLGTSTRGPATPGYRTRLAIRDRSQPLLALFVLLVLLGGGLTYTTHVDPGTHVETRTVSTWESTAAWSHEARVTRSNPVFTRGTTLSDRPVYFMSIAPRLEGTFRYGYTASDRGNLSTDVTTTLVLRSVGEQEGEQVEYWRVTEPLGPPSSARLSPGERLRTPFEMNVSAVQQRVDRIEARLGGTPGETEARVLARVRATGTVNGQSVSRFTEHAVTVELDEGTYQVTDSETSRTRQNTTRELTVRNSYGPLRRLGSPLVLLVGAVGVVGLAGAGATGRLDVPDDARERLTFEADRREFDDWITPGTVALPERPDARIEVDSLEGLVDVAIDTDNRVIEDLEQGGYLVLDDERTYRFDPPPEPRWRGVEAVASGDDGRADAEESEADGDENE